MPACPLRVHVARSRARARHVRNGGMGPASARMQALQAAIVLAVSAGTGRRRLSLRPRAAAGCGRCGFPVGGPPPAGPARMHECARKCGKRFGVVVSNRHHVVGKAHVQVFRIRCGDGHDSGKRVGVLESMRTVGESQAAARWDCGVGGREGEPVYSASQGQLDLELPRS